MTIQFGQITTIDAVLGAIESRLVTAGGYPPERVSLYLGDHEDLLQQPPGDRHCAVGILGLPVMRDLVAGGGELPFSGRFQVSLLRRVGLDQDRRDKLYLRHASLGVLRDLTRVLQALQLWYPVENSTSIFIEPSRVVEDGISFAPRRPKPGWGLVKVPINIKFRTKP